MHLSHAIELGSTTCQFRLDDRSLYSRARPGVSVVPMLRVEDPGGDHLRQLVSQPGLRPPSRYRPLATDEDHYVGTAEFVVVEEALKQI